MNTYSRRNFLQTLSLAALASPFGGLNSAQAEPASDSKGEQSLLKPPALHHGSTVMLVGPASATFETVDVEIARDALRALGLEVRLGAHLLARRGYLAGSDKDRAADINTAFSDPEIDAVIAMRGGWGSARLLPLLDYDMIREHPKIFMGYSDITALLLALYDRAGLVTFHGPVAISSWDSFTVSYVKRVLFKGDAVTMQNDTQHKHTLAQREHRVQTIHPGRARGIIIGGNLTIITTIIGSGYLPDFDDKILFIEDVDEDVYRIDRMLTQLKLAGILRGIKGLIFGHCTKCRPGGFTYGSLTLMDVLNHHIAPLKIPAWYGSMIGHMDKIFTVPEGTPVEIDAMRGTIRMLEPAVR